MHKLPLVFVLGVAWLPGCATTQKQSQPAEQRLERSQTQEPRYAEGSQAGSTAPVSRAPAGAALEPQPQAGGETSRFTAIMPTGTGRVSAPGVPLPSEMPDLRFEERRTTSVRANVELWGEDRLRARIVPMFPPVEPTPEERAILGEPPPDPYADLLAFYRPPPSVDQGVLPMEVHVTSGALPPTTVAGSLPERTKVTGVDTAEVGRFVAPTFGRTGAAAYSARAGAGAVYREGTVRIGYDRARHAGAQAPTLDP